MSITPELLLHAYSVGVFPMAEHQDDPELFWVDPKRRGVMAMDGFHISRSLAKAMRKTTFCVTMDDDFEGVIDGCADRGDTWINPQLRRLYTALFEGKAAHSLEVWEGDTLVGGVFGVSIGAAFFGESMFSRRTNASKIALACLIETLGRGGFCLFDTQFITQHLASLGAVEISRAQYRRQLAEAIEEKGKILGPAQPYDVVQRITQTS